MSAPEDLDDSAAKSSKIKTTIIFLGVFFALLVGMYLRGIATEKIIDEESVAKTYVEKQNYNHKLFSRHDANISKMVFNKFPEAYSVLVGNLYIVGEEFQLFIRPTGVSKKYIKDFDYYSIIQNETGLGIYIVSGKLVNGNISSISIKPWHPELHQKKAEWSWSFASLASSILNGYLYVVTGGKDVNKAVAEFSNALVEFSIEGVPYTIYTRENEDTNDSTLFSVTTMNEVRLTGKEDGYGAPITLIDTNKTGCVFNALPEHLNGENYRFEIKDMRCSQAGITHQFQGLSVIGEDGVYGIKADEADGYFVINKGRKIDILARHLKTTD